MRICALLAVAVLVPAPLAAQQEQPPGLAANRALEVAELRGLDTLNGTTHDIDAPVGETVRYGNLEVTVETCRVPEADPEGDAVAFLRIRDVREDEPRFTGWMFASSPALSALDHPRYDVWVLSCRSR